MKLAIVAYPDLDEEDRQWIEEFDNPRPSGQTARVHFTLVFPYDAAASDLGLSEVLAGHSQSGLRFVMKAVQDKLERASSWC
jgi:hypothetical protein